MQRECLIAIVFGYILANVLADILPEKRTILTTGERISSYGYDVEEHTVQTSDGYILTMFRIPHSPKLNNTDEPKPVMFLLHGWIASSDDWILPGPDSALAFLLADAGYDVWLGNARGSTYSKKHVKLSPLLPQFWDFSWHEIGIFDLPAMIDYVLSRTQEPALHYVGHSQGATVFFVLLSEIPSYSDKIKTSHLLAPCAYMEHMKSPVGTVLGSLLEHPSLLIDLIGKSEFLPTPEFLHKLGAEACADQSPFQEICANIFFLIFGWGSQHLNYTVLHDVLETHPASCSTAQIIHYMQLRNSGHFRQYDYGLQNLIVYGRLTPPDYKVENIQLQVPTRFVYSDNDYFAAVTDVERLAVRLGNNVEMCHIEYPDWNHVDFIFAKTIKDIINDPIIKSANDYELSRM